MTAMPSRALQVLGLMFVAVAMAATTVRGDYSPKDAVVILTDKNFEKEVLGSPDYWLVEFYAPWCGHCKQLEPEYKAAAKKLKQHARLGVVDATVHTQLAQKYKIQGYPTIKEFGANKKKPRDYQGGRSRKDIVQYVKNSDEAKKLGVSGIAVPSVDFSTLHTLLHQDEGIPTALFFGSTKKTKKKAPMAPPSWLGSVAQQFIKGKKKKVPTVQVLFVPGSESKIAAHIGLDENVPALVFIDAASSKFFVADLPKLTAESAKTFIQTSMGATSETVETWKDLPLFPAPEVAKKKPKVSIQELTASAMDSCMGKKGKMCVVITTGASDDKLREVAKRYRRDPLKFFTLPSGSPLASRLEDATGVKGSSVVVIKPGRKVKYAALSTDGADDAIVRFLDKVVDGSMHFRIGGATNSEENTEPTPATVEHEEL